MKTTLRLIIVAAVVAAALIAFISFGAKPKAVAQFEGCVWPRCSGKPVAAVPLGICLWPHLCSANS